MFQPPTGHQVIFDLGNVLIRWDPRNLYRKIFGEDVQGMEWFLANVCNPAWNDRLDAGQSFAAAVAERIAEFPDHAELIRAYHERWFETLGEPINANVEVLADLKRLGYRVHALTNWSAETFYPAKKLFPFLTWFDGVVVSGEEGLVKPDSRIYKRLLERYQIDAASAVFIDDVTRNVEAARQLGITTVQFVDGVDLRQELRQLGMPIPA
ncbi:MAG: HAD family phosphatase [Deltaproteobacteria bacterium]|nr:HAD family phosphatase [Deltaproteobacteria bacterium]